MLRFIVAYKRFIDIIPNQIDNSYILPLGQALDVALTRLTRKADLTQCQAWLEESPERVQRRKELLGRKERLALVYAKMMPIIREVDTMRRNEDAEPDAAAPESEEEQEQEQQFSKKAVLLPDPIDPIECYVGPAPSVLEIFESE